MDISRIYLNCKRCISKCEYFVLFYPSLYSVLFVYDEHIYTVTVCGMCSESECFAHSLCY